MYQIFDLRSRNAVLPKVMVLFACFSINGAHADEMIYVKGEDRAATRQESMKAIRDAFDAPEFTQSPWVFIGPFPNSDGEGVAIEYPPEVGIDLEGEYEGHDGEIVRWQDGSRFVDGAAHDLAIFSENEFVLAYFYRTVEVDEATSATLLLGSDDSIAVWVNGEKEYDFRGARPVTVDQDQVGIDLEEGVNHLLLKIGNLAGNYGFSYRLSALSKEEQSRFNRAVTRMEEQLDIDFPIGAAVYYRIETLPIPDDIVFEVGGMNFMPNGELMVSTRRGEVWSVDVENESWSLFASGLHEALGVLPAGPGEIIVTQRPELTRIKDTSGDGKADLFETLTDAWGISGNYHEYVFGPVRDEEGNLFGTLNVGWEDGGVSWVPYRGWAFKLTPEGEFIPWATGLRSPSGIGIDPEGEIFVTDNQGDWFGTSPLVHVDRGDFFGHPAGLKWEEGYDGPEDPRTIAPEELAPRRKLPAAWFTFGPLGRSPSEPIWDTTGGSFGPFENQMFVGDQTHSNLMRIALEKVQGEYQGAIFPFREGFASGILRLAFAEDGALYVGQTDRGWGAAGGSPYALQRLIWTGEVPMEIHTMNLTEDGFELTFTKPVDVASASDPSSYSLEHYHYLYRRGYGSPRVDVTSVEVNNVQVSADGMRVSLVLPELVTKKIYELHISGLTAEDGTELLNPSAYYTLNQLVGTPRQGDVILPAIHFAEVEEEAPEESGELAAGEKEADGVAPLTEEQQEFFELGQRNYRMVCASCHQINGQGIEGVAPGLVDSKWAMGPEEALISIILYGKQGQAMMMPPWGWLDDAQIASIATYVRRDWNNTADPVSTETVEKVRDAYADRTGVWTEEDLLREFLTE